MFQLQLRRFISVIIANRVQREGGRDGFCAEYIIRVGVFCMVCFCGLGGDQGGNACTVSTRSRDFFFTTRFPPDSKNSIAIVNFAWSALVVLADDDDPPPPRLPLFHDRNRRGNPKHWSRRKCCHFHLRRTVRIHRPHRHGHSLLLWRRHVDAHASDLLEPSL